MPRVPHMTEQLKMEGLDTKTVTLYPRHTPWVSTDCFCMHGDAPLT
jgi:hypothetical protein